MSTFRRAFFTACAVIGCALPAVAVAAIAVSTYHYNIQRTGWNNQETVLSAAAFPANFGVLATVALDDQVDAQPLLVPGETIAGAQHDVLYVVTESNSVYALDASSGQVLLRRNLGTPVHMPLGCGNNGPNVGINSTPVIDLGRHRLYVMAYVQGTSPQYVLHALDLVTLTDAVPAVTVSASHTLTDGSTFTFNATYQRQRPALLEVKGVIYAGFGSFCDFSASRSRGWVLGWSAPNLAPLAANQLNDAQASSATDFFLSSVWMSGFGLSSNGTNIFFSTGNSDCNFYLSPEQCPPQTTYDGATNIQESVIGLAPTLATRTGVFTPSNVFQMDIDDADLGAAGVLLLPPLSGSALASIVSKDGRLWLLNQNNLATVLDLHQLGAGCWCGLSYFRGADGVPRIVSGAGSLQTWQVLLQPAPHLSAESTTTTIPATEQDPGFFTVVSSNARKAGSQIIWAVGRPTTNDNLTLYAFSASVANGTLPLLYSGVAGQWPNLGGNANVVPLVANGKVYVGAYKTLTIFGPGGSPPAAQPVLTVQSGLPANVSRVTGKLVARDGDRLTLLARTGESVAIDAAPAVTQQRAAPAVLGNAYTAIGAKRTAGTVWEVSAIMRAKPGEGAWPKDQ